jgi:subtilisin
MTDISGDTRSGLGRDRGGRRAEPYVARSRPYLVAPAGPGATKKMLIDRLERTAGVEIVRSYAERGAAAAPIAVARMSEAGAAALRRSTGGMLVIEPDRRLRAASFMAAPQGWVAPGIAALGAGLSTTIRAVSDNDRPLEQAEVRLVGEQGAAQGLAGRDGKVELTLYGELPETISELFVRPRSGCWGLWRRWPQLNAGAENTVTLRSISPSDEHAWGARAMRLDRLPAECRGRGIKIALVDTGVATSHRQLSSLDHGIDLRSGDQRSWSQDGAGHGTPLAGIIGAAAISEHGIRGYAPESELHVCRLPLDARCSDLVAALDYCLEAGVDLVCLGFGCERGSSIVEQRIALAKQHGIGVIAAAGNGAGPVEFPACSPHVLAVGAIGEAGTFPDDSPQAAQLAMQAGAGAPTARQPWFVPPFSCRGPELDLCAPGLAVIACQTPGDYAVCDGTSVAAAHVAALAAVILAHHRDFRAEFGRRDFRRVERLFQILKDTAQPIGHPWHTGAGLPDAAQALGLPPQQWAAAVPLDDALREMRGAIRRAAQLEPGVVTPGGLSWGAASDIEPPLMFEPPRGPANVTRLPLDPLPLTFAPGTAGSGGAGGHELKAAMMLAGLA